MPGDMSSMRVLRKKSGQVRKVRVLPVLEKQAQGVELPGK